MTGDGRALPAHLKTQISRELDRLELLLDHIKAVEVERDALLTEFSSASRTLMHESRVLSLWPAQRSFLSW
jgi:transposase